MTDKMLALVKKKPKKGLNLEYVNVPEIGPNDVLVKVKFTSICGSDLPIYNWNKWAPSRIKLPRILGHEFSGKVIEVGEKVTKVKVGDSVSAESHWTCGKCYQCLINQKYACQKTMIRGIDFDGCFAEYHVIREEEVWKNDDIDAEAASLQEPFGSSIHTVTSYDVGGKTVAIFGCGPIGLFAIMISKALGVKKVICVEKIKYRLDLAKKVGCDEAILATDNVVEEIMQITNGTGVDTVFEMSGAKQALLQGVKVVRFGGNISILGLYGSTVDINFNDIVMKGVTIQGIIGRRIWNDWFIGKALIKCGKVDLKKVITHRFQLEDYKEAFETMNSAECGKVIIKMS